MVRTHGTVRRLAALLVGLATAASLVSGCDATFPGTTVRVAAGSPAGVYNALGGTLAEVWRADLGLAGVEVQQTGGSVDNLNRLLSGAADVGFSAADVATQPRGGGERLRALARIYDDYLHVAVRADSAITDLAGLAGKRVAVGTADSGTVVIAQRVLRVADLATDQVPVNLDAAGQMLREGTIDGLFWSGGLPSLGMAKLAGAGLLRLLDLGDVLPEVRKQYPVYNTASIAATTYDTERAVTTLAVPNFLLVTDAMADEVAQELTRGLYEARQRLVAVNKAALAIDELPGIETDPVPLHPGALRYYQEQKI
ncbi:TAXI family TRAP transporter solute-binding subunit [Actinokineospora pegani]|uniref:TAXI family TRAP transporter solute-binding subunit n=1 Tax=Actinokineospora pegani TaxID=2654637 RepID=UPI0012EAF197|nr:TAXI family TRAP transporter solute-binding subunit [Actinokineospora pegani]